MADPNAPVIGPLDPRRPAGAGDLRLPAGFLMGTQTSAVQVEGGGIDNDITRWAATHPGWAAPNPGLDHWNRIDADYRHLSENGHTAHGFTVDWGRIEPAEGRFDEAAIAHYRDEILTCRRLGMEPIVTTLQYAIPNWLAARGGILDPETPRLFERFVRVCAERFGDQVTWWNTMNEPNTLAAAGFLAGIWPPGRSSIFDMGRAYDALLRMHAGAATAIRDVQGARGRRSMISFAHNVDPHYAWQWWNPADQAGARLYDYVANHWFVDAIEKGRSVWPVGAGDEIPGLRGSIDYIALNYYGRTWSHLTLGGSSKLGSPLQGEPDPDVANPSAPYSDPDGLYSVALNLYNQFHLPIMIAENGVDIPEPDSQNLRGRAIVDHLSVFHHLMRAGVPILGYLHWTDWDSPEWHDGWSQHYGLFGFDHVTGRRWDKPAANTFEVIARRNAIPAEWLSPRNLQSPALRDGRCAQELRRLRGWLQRHATQRVAIAL